MQGNLHSIRSIQPYENDYADLEVIDKAIGDARIVMLGEQDHGDGATFLAKTRLIKYLHEKQGFNVLIFEGDFFALNHGWQVTPADEHQQRSFLYSNIYPYWSKCKECDDLLYDYIPQTYRTNSPLQIAGIDNQLYAGFSRDSLKHYLNSYLSPQQVSFIELTSYQDFFLS